jgi:hypothetical protein
VVRGGEAAGCTQALAEGSDDEVDLRLDTVRLRHAAAAVAEDAQRVGLVDEEVGSVPLLHRGKLGDGRLVAQHAVQSLDDDQLAGSLAFQTGEPAIEVSRIVVAETHHGGAAQLAGVIDAGMRVGVDEDHVLRPGETGDRSEIGLITGGEDHHRTAIQESSERRLELRVTLLRAVGDP